MGDFSSLAQWQELELQALIYKYILAGASVPLELIVPIKKSLLRAHPYYYHPQQNQNFQSTSHWGRFDVDTELGRCRRTDGKKWRCSREAVMFQKYCECHLHRGRNRSRKPVEIPSPTVSSGLETTLASPLIKTKEAHFTPSGPSAAFDIFPFNHRCCSHLSQTDDKTGSACLSQSHCPNFACQEFGDNKPDSHVFRRFLDDWPRSQQEPNNNNDNRRISTTHLSTSIPRNSLSGFSLKLTTGNNNKPELKDSGDQWGRTSISDELVRVGEPWGDFSE